MYKRIITISLSLLSLNAFSQLNLPKVQDQQTIGLTYFKTDLGLGAGMEYHYYTMDNLALGARLNYDWGRPYQAYYKSFGIDLGGSYAPLPIGDNFFINVKLYGSIASQKISDKAEINKNVFNYGGKGGGSIEYYMNSGTVVELYGLQGFFAKKDLGQKMYEIGFTFKLIL